MLRCRLTSMTICFILVLSVACIQAFAGTPISPPTVTQTAWATWDQEVTYQWALSKSVYPNVIDIPCGQSASVAYQLNINRSIVSNTSSPLTISGNVTVKNNTAAYTNGLAITVRLLSNHVEIDSQSLPVDEIAAASLGTFSYTFNNKEKGAVYQVETTVTVTNYPGHQDIAFGPGPVTNDVIVSTGPLGTIEHDATANLTDTVVCPIGFACTPEGFQQSLIVGSLTSQYDMSIVNESATCGGTKQLVNVATLKPVESLPSTADATVTITTGQCAGGCTRTIGYWKNHKSEIPPYLPIDLGSRWVTSSDIAVDVVSMRWGNPSNGITKLYAQLLASKLNIRYGADSWAVNGTLSSAESFLQTHTQDSWNTLSRDQRMQVLGWVSDLDNYNNGLTGPGHCN